LGGGGGGVVGGVCVLGGGGRGAPPPRCVAEVGVSVSGCCVAEVCCVCAVWVDAVWQRWV